MRVFGIQIQVPGSGSTKFLNTNQIWIRIHNTVYKGPNLDPHIWCSVADPKRFNSDLYPFFHWDWDQVFMGPMQGCGSTFIFCGSGSTQCGSGSSGLLHAAPALKRIKKLTFWRVFCSWKNLKDCSKVWKKMELAGSGKIIWIFIIPDPLPILWIKMICNTA